MPRRPRFSAPARAASSPLIRALAERQRQMGASAPPVMLRASAMAMTIAGQPGRNAWRLAQLPAFAMAERLAP